MEDKNIRRSKSEKRSNTRVFGYRPPQRSSYADANEAILEQQAESNMSVLAPSISRRAQRAIRREARRDVRSGALVVDEQGAAQSMFINAAACRAQADADYNVRHFYAVTLPTVSQVLATARGIASRRAKAPEAAPVQGAGPRARRALAAARARTEARASELEESYDELGALLSAYQTARLLLNKRLDRCQNQFENEVAIYLEEALRDGTGPLSALPWRRRLPFSPAALINAGHRAIELPAMPTNIFRDMSPEQVVENLEDLRLPDEYGRLTSESARDEHRGWMPREKVAAA